MRRSHGEDENYGTRSLARQDRLASESPWALFIPESWLVDDCNALSGGGDVRLAIVIEIADHQVPRRTASRISRRSLEGSVAVAQQNVYIPEAPGSACYLW